MSMIHDITSKVKRYKNPKRKGRGEGSGTGKTAGRGTKGSGARVGKPLSLHHEGGQTRIYRRLPTRGFSNDRFATRWHIVNVSDLEEHFEDGQPVDASALIEKGLIPDNKHQVKVLGDGNLTRKLTVIAGWYSKSAVQKIQAAGGTVQNVKGEPFAFPKPLPKFEKQTAQQQGGGKKKKQEQAAAGEGEKPAAGEAPAAAGEPAAAAAPAPATEEKQG